MNDIPAGYKQTEVGVIPEEWEAPRLGEAADVLMGQSPSGASYNRSGIGVPLINGPTEFTEKHPVKIQWTSEPTKYCRKGDVLLCVRGSSTGRMNISDDEYCIGRGVAAIRAKSGADTPFITYQVASAVQEILALTTGSTFPNIDGKSIRAIQISLPPLPEQRAIAGALSDVDALIGALDSAIAKKRDLKQAAMQQLLTGKKRLTGFHGEWEVKTLQEITDCLDNVRVPLNEAQRAQMRGDYPYCGANGVLDFVNGYVIDDDIILIAEDGGYFDEYAYRPIAYRMVGKCWVNNHAHILKAKEGFDQGFFFYSLVHKNILRFLASGTRAKLNKSEMWKVEVNVPVARPEQTAIAEVLSDMDAELAALTQRRDKTRALKQGMMQKLLTGRTRLI